jgi:hypothetical protein
MGFPRLHRPDNKTLSAMKATNSIDSNSQTHIWQLLSIYCFVRTIFTAVEVQHREHGNWGAISVDAKSSRAVGKEELKIAVLC